MLAFQGKLFCTQLFLCGLQPCTSLGFYWRSVICLVLPLGEYSESYAYPCCQEWTWRCLHSQALHITPEVCHATYWTGIVCGIYMKSLQVRSEGYLLLMVKLPRVLQTTISFFNTQQLILKLPNIIIFFDTYLCTCLQGWYQFPWMIHKTVISFLSKMIYKKTLFEMNLHLLQGWIYLLNNQLSYNMVHVDRVL